MRQHRQEICPCKSKHFVYQISFAVRKIRRCHILFQYELTPLTTSLFKDSQMRKTNKAALANHLISDVQMSHCPQNVKTAVFFFIG